MAVQGLNHVNIYCANAERTRDFYVDVLGLTVGQRPPFDFPGFWLYAGGAPIVHLVGPRGDGARVPGPTGLLDHVAFTAHDPAVMRERLRASGVAFQERIVPRDNSLQFFLRDPDGVGVELTFASGA